MKSKSFSWKHWPKDSWLKSLKAVVLMHSEQLEQHFSSFKGCHTESALKIGERNSQPFWICFVKFENMRITEYHYQNADFIIHSKWRMNVDTLKV